MARFDSVEDYLDSLSPAVRAAVDELRRRAHAVLPGAEEVLRYDIVAVQVDGRTVVHIAGWARHVSLYPMPALDDDLGPRLAPYASGRGTLKFPLSQPIPYDLAEAAIRALAAQRGPAGGL